MNNKTEKIWQEFHPKLRQFINRRVSDKDVADDILQDVFIKIHKTLRWKKALWLILYWRRSKGGKIFLRLVG